MTTSPPATKADIDAAVATIIAKIGSAIVHHNTDHPYTLDVIGPLVIQIASGLNITSPDGDGTGWAEVHVVGVPDVNVVSEAGRPVK